MSIPHAIPLAIASFASSAICLANIGCAQHNATRHDTLEASRTTSTENHINSNNAQPVDESRKTTTDKNVAFTRSNTTSGNGRRSNAIIAIYGDSIARSTSAPGVSDGDSNMAQVSFATEGADFDPDIDPDGKWLYYASTQHRATSDIYRKPIDGSTVTQLTSDPADDMMPDVSPDGTHIAFCSNRAGNWDILVMPVDGGQPRVVTDDPSPEVHPSWSPDGRSLVYSKYNELNGRWELWTVDVDNTSVRNFLDYGFLPEWSPDPAQNKILFQRARNRGSRYHSIWTIDIIDDQGRNPTEIISAANAAAINPSWSPDGDRIVFVTVVNPEQDASETPSQSDLWTVRLDGTGRISLTNGSFANFQPVWTNDDRVLFVSDRGGTENIWSVAARRSTPPQGNADAMATVPEGTN